jgi:aspartate/methionine/tyrosine aminotransferase
MTADPKRASMPRGRATIRAQVAGIDKQLINEVSKYGLGQPDVIPLWYGESDLATPDFICEAAARAMRAGETFYSHKRGLPELRQALADYQTGLYGTEIDTDRITITTSGMNAIMIVMQSLLDAGDNVATVHPVWPNANGAVSIMGAETRPVLLDTVQGHWHLDLDRLFAACDDRTRAIFVNSPGNPTGWMMEADDQRALLEFCRERGIWLVADEVYARIVYDRPVAPSFLQVAGPDDPLVVINSFSKSWAMTGWRMGWLVTPEWMGEALFDLIEYNTSCVPPFLQKAGYVAVTEGEAFTRRMVEHCRTGREACLPRLAAMPKVRLVEPQAAFYAFFAVEGLSDSVSFAQKLLRETRVGMAPGLAFGRDGEGWLRLCYASDPKRIAVAMDRIEPFLS